MKLIAKQAIPGKRYLTRRNVLVEIVPSKVFSGSPRLDSHGEVLVWVVLNPGTSEETLSTKMSPIPPGYVLEDPSIAVVPPTVPAFAPRKGRKKLPEGSWTSLARVNILPQQILDIAKAHKFYVRMTDKYFICGCNGRNLFAIFRDGTVALPKQMSVEFYKKLPFKKISSSGFMPFRVKLEDVVVHNNSSTLLQLVTHISDQILKHKDAAVV